VKISEKFPSLDITQDVGMVVAKAAERPLGSARDWARGWSSLSRTIAGLYLSGIGPLKWGRRKKGKRKVRDESQQGKLRRNDACVEADFFNYLTVCQCRKYVDVNKACVCQKKSASVMLTWLTL
jgi:hypothetical protein